MTLWTRDGLKRTIGAAVLVIAVAACGGDDGGGGGGGAEADSAVVELLVAQGAPADEASCYASELDEYSAEDLEVFFSAESEEEIDLEIVEAFNAAAETCATDESTDGDNDGEGEGEGDGGDSSDGDSAPAGDPQPAAALPDHVVAGTPVDDSFALDVADTNGLGTANSSCTESFVAASGLDASIADCIHVTSALSDWVAVVATVPTGNELWMACSDDEGGFTFGLRWAGTVQGITPMDDPTIGSGLVVSLVDDASVVHHVVMWDQYADALCPTSTVEQPGTPGTGPIVQAGGIHISLDDGDKNVCYRPEDGVWTRGTTDSATC